MNFLAHLALSDNAPELMIGNSIADFTRRKFYDQYSEGIRKGIELHHFIDEFTDSHAIVGEMLEAWRPTQGKYAGVVNDIVMDHFLARSFQNWTGENLETFAQKAYELFRNYWSVLPERAQHTFTYMERGNWLKNYQHRYGLESSLNGMSRRAQNENRMAHAVIQLDRQEDFFKERFENFFPELQKAVQDQL